MYVERKRMVSTVIVILIAMTVETVYCQRWSSATVRPSAGTCIYHYFGFLNRRVSIFRCVLVRTSQVKPCKFEKVRATKSLKFSILKPRCTLSILPRSRLNLRMMYLKNHCSQPFATDSWEFSRRLGYLDWIEIWLSYNLMKFFILVRSIARTT